MCSLEISNYKLKIYVERNAIIINKIGSGPLIYLKGATWCSHRGKREDRVINLGEREGVNRITFLCSSIYLGFYDTIRIGWPTPILRKMVKNKAKYFAMLEFRTFTPITIDNR